MRSAPFALAFIVAACPALAWQEPKPIADGSPICTVPYNPNDGVRIVAVPGNTVTVELGETRGNLESAASDTATLAQRKSANTMWLKAKGPMPPQPISVRATRQDGKAEIYVLQWSATEDAPQAKCDLVRFTYPQDAADAARAAAAKRRDDWLAGQAARDLRSASRLPTAASTVNRSYTLSGAAALIPMQIAPTPGGTAATPIAQGATR